MARKLPARPNLDHLRRQAKRLLADLESQDPAAAKLIREYLPSAKEWTEAQILANRFRLADAQSAIARKTGFAGWPHLARHVEQLRSLEGTWTFGRLEIDGQAVPAGELASSRVLIDGDRFRSETPEGIYEGTFNLNVEVEPHEIDIEFIAGPEAGNWNHGIFRLKEDQLDLCLDLRGSPRPKAFQTSVGSGHAWETLCRVSGSRPEGVTGGVASTSVPVVVSSAMAPAAEASSLAANALLVRMQGEWSAVKIVKDGHDLPQAMLRTASRSATGDVVKINVGSKTVLHARVRLDPQADPVRVDYFRPDHPGSRAFQEGIMRWEGDELWFCMSDPGQQRPDQFTSRPGSGWSLSRWRRNSER